jgi:hypothetical protein
MRFMGSRGVRCRYGGRRRGGVRCDHLTFSARVSAVGRRANLIVVA